MRDRTNYRLRDGDTVEFRSPQPSEPVWANGRRVPGPEVPAGARGVVVYARTAKVVLRRDHRPGDSLYFANVDVPQNGKTLRVRCPHQALRRVRSAPAAAGVS